jgi:hypothetical protein
MGLWYYLHIYLAVQTVYNKEGSQYEGPQYEGSQYEGSQYEGSQYEGSQYNPFTIQG